MWDNAQVPVQERPAPEAPFGSIAPGAEMVAAGQALVAGLVWLVTLDMQDDYGAGIAPLGFLCTLVFLPPIAYAVGWLHSLLLTVPVMMLSNAAGLRTRLRAPWWGPPALVLFSAVYALPLFGLFDASYAVTWGWIAASGAIPAAVAVFARMRILPVAKVRRRALGAGVVAVVLTIGGGITAVEKDMIPAYQPPVLSHAGLVGAWTGDGTRLVLRADGTATAVRLPVVKGLDEVARCTGTGTWDAIGESGGYRAGVRLTVPDCRDAELRWQVAGTAQEPELFVFVGDPDSGDLRRLHPDG